MAAEWTHFPLNQRDFDSKHSGMSPVKQSHNKKSHIIAQRLVEARHKGIVASANAFHLTFRREFSVDGMLFSTVINL